MPLQKKLLQTFMRSLEQIDYGSLKLTLPDGKQHLFSAPQSGPEADMTLHQYDVIKNMAMGGDVALCQDYCQGHWDTENLTELMMFAIKNESSLDQQGHISGKIMMRQLGRLRDWWRSNTKRGAKKNIEVHYDLGNPFYELWLDPSMTYSSALFNDTTQTLEQAQTNKYANIFNQIDCKNQSILEIGCGWGGFADYAHQHGAHYQKGITLSKEQQEYAATRMCDKLQDQAFYLQDYRDERNQYDRVVSIEMFEAVGKKYWPQYFKTIKAALKPSGKAMVQTITIQNALFERYAKSTDLIRTYIFPGGLLPSPSVFKAHAEQAGLKITYEHFFGHSYAQTLTHWLSAFDQKQGIIESMGYHTSFQRLWRFYLTSCIAAFSHQKTNVMQVALEHA